MNSLVNNIEFIAAYNATKRIIREYSNSISVGSKIPYSYIKQSQRKSKHDIKNIIDFMLSKNLLGNCDNEKEYTLKPEFFKYNLDESLNFSKVKTN